MEKTPGPNVLCMDVGSTNIKYREGTGEIRSLPFPAGERPGPNRYEVPVRKIWELISAVIERSGASALFLSVQMHGYILLGEDREPVTAYISWRDQRAKGVRVPFSVPAENGVSIKPNLPRASLYAMSLTDPEVCAEAREFCTLGSYLALRLTGKNRTHITDAAASGFYRANTCRGESKALRLPVADGGVSLIGRTERGMKVYAPVGDQQASVLGSGATEEDYILNLGTAGQLCCIQKEFVAGDFESRPYFGGKTLCTVTGLPAGGAIQNEGVRIIPEMTAACLSALKKLPLRRRILAVGGAAGHYRAMVERVLEKIGLPFEILSGEMALNGLSLLADQTADREE